MAFQDSDPERRNLMLTSLAFIAYFFAGGEFKETTVRLQVVNVNFTRPEILALISWMTLFWFLYRYWQTHTGAFEKGFRAEFYKFYTKPYISRYISKKIGKNLITNEDEGYRIDGMRIEGYKIYITYSYVLSVIRNMSTKEIEIFTNKKDSNGEVSLNEFYGLLLKIRMVLECCAKYPSFSSYIVPYILFVFVIIGVIYRSSPI